MEFPKSFSFDWVLRCTDTHKVEWENFFTENGHDIVFLRVQDYSRLNDCWTTRYQVGNPLLGGIKSYQAYNTAEKYFFELLGRVHMDAVSRKAKEVQ